MIDPSLIKAYCRERDALLRALDQEKFDDHCRRWGIPTPREGWLPSSRLILMHKARLSLQTFTPEEKEESRRWLEEHHCSMEI